MTQLKSEGRQFLERQSELAKARAGRPPITNILVVEDNERDTKSISARMRKVFGQNVTLHHATSIDSMLDKLVKSKPELIFLDHLLKPNDTAFQSVKYARDFGYAGPIVVVSSVMTDKLAAELRRIGVSEALHKDQLSGGRIAEVLDLLHTMETTRQPPTTGSACSAPMPGQAKAELPPKS